MDSFHSRRPTYGTSTSRQRLFRPITGLGSWCFTAGLEDSKDHKEIKAYLLLAPRDLLDRRDQLEQLGTRVRKAIKEHPGARVRKGTKARKAHKVLKGHKEGRVVKAVKETKARRVSKGQPATKGRPVPKVGPSLAAHTYFSRAREETPALRPPGS